MLSSATMVVVTAGRTNDTLCYDNAIARNSLQGPSLCVIQAGVVLYCMYASALSWMLQSIDLALKLIFGIKRDFMSLYFAVIFSLPTIPLGIAAGYGYLGYPRSAFPPFCFIVGSDVANFDSGGDNLNLELLLVYYPLSVIAAIGLIFFAIVVSNSLFVLYDPKKSEPFFDKLRPLYMPILFTCTFLVWWCCIIIVAVIRLKTRNPLFIEVKSWAMCIFKNFFGDDEGAWAVCGRATQSSKLIANPIGRTLLPNQSLLVSVLLLPHFLIGWYNKLFSFWSKPKINPTILYSTNLNSSSVGDNMVMDDGIIDNEQLSEENISSNRLSNQMEVVEFE